MNPRKSIISATLRLPTKNCTLEVWMVCGRTGVARRGCRRRRRRGRRHRHSRRRLGCRWRWSGHGRGRRTHCRRRQ